MVIVTAKHTTQQGGNNVKMLCMLTFSVTCTVLLLTLLFTDPIVLALRWYTRVTNGSLVHQMMYREMEGGHLSVTLFNITNAERFMEGEDEKLKVEEVGPFTYIEMRRMQNLSFDFEKGVMFCNPKMTKRFELKESVGRPEDLNVTMPNLPMLGLTSQMTAYPYWARVSLDMLIRQLKSKPLVSMDAHSYLWGYEDSLLSLAHNIIPGSIKFNKIGILDRIYDGEADNILEASIKDDDKFMIYKRNGKTKLPMSPSVDPEDCELCDSFKDTYEGIGYPTGVKPGFPIHLYRIGLCRTLEMEYFGRKPMSYGGDALVYHFSNRFYSLNHSDVNDGVLVMSDCFMGTPLAVTKTHFLDMDPALYSRIEGMKPDEKYRGWISIEPISGIQVETDFTLQMNLVFGDVGHSAQARRFSNMILPICYIRIVQPPLPEESHDIMNKMYVTGPLIVFYTRIVLFVLCLASWIYVARIAYVDRIMSRNIFRGIEKGITFDNKTETEKADNVTVPFITSHNNNNNVQS